MTQEAIYWGGEYIPYYTFRKKLLGTKEPNEPQDDYKEPFAIKSIQNKIEMLQFREGDLLKERIATIKQIKKHHDKYDKQIVEMEKSLDYFNNRLKDTEEQLKLAVKDLRKQYEYV